MLKVLFSLTVCIEVVTAAQHPPRWLLVFEATSSAVVL